MEYEKLFKDKVILITGGTGFLGRYLTKEILKYNPQSIRIFSRDEVKHHNVQEQFKYDTRLRNLIGDIRDSARLKRALENVDIVIHAAALKRLDILEYNVAESVNTNILGTLNVVDGCLSNNVEKAVFVSTDKACSPVNSYGACKFVGERIFTESNYSKGNKRTVFTCVRYGNVLESTGSVIPFFKSKIRSKEQIPLTHKDMTRFIISPKQAVELIFKALLYSKGGEIFIPILPAFKIIDLIDILKEKYNADNEIKIIGIRPGEKIHELMINNAEIVRTQRFQDIYIIKSSIENDENKPKDTSKIDAPKKAISMTEYSSKDALISKEDTKKLLMNLKLI